MSARRRGRPVDPSSARQQALRALRKRGRARLLIEPRPGESYAAAAARTRDVLRDAARTAGINATTYRDGDYMRAQVIRRAPVQGLLRVAVAA